MATRQSDPDTTESGRIHHMTAEEGMAMLDRLARKTMDMSGEEFITAWESGEFDGQRETPELIRLVLLIPFTR
jgi:hypothetical protein